MTPQPSSIASPPPPAVRVGKRRANRLVALGPITGRAQQDRSRYTRSTRRIVRADGAQVCGVPYVGLGATCPVRPHRRPLPRPATRPTARMPGHRAPRRTRRDLTPYPRGLVRPGGGCRHKRIEPDPQTAIAALQKAAQDGKAHPRSSRGYGQTAEPFAGPETGTTRPNQPGHRIATHRLRKPRPAAVTYNARHAGRRRRVRRGRDPARRCGQGSPAARRGRRVETFHTVVRWSSAASAPIRGTGRAARFVQDRDAALPHSSRQRYAATLAAPRARGDTAAGR